MERLTRIESKLDKMSDKLDNHLERVSKLEERVEGISGNIKLVLSIFTALLTAAAAAVFKLITGGFK